MIRTIWQGSAFDLRRIVFRGERVGSYEEALRAVARRLGLPIGDDDSVARAGDLWISSYPTSRRDPAAEAVHWVSPIEVPLAVARLLQLAEQPFFAQDADAPLDTTAPGPGETSREMW